MRMLHVSRGPAPTVRSGGTAGALADVLAIGVRGALARLALWHERARQRRQLRALSDAMLKDLGLNRNDADTEAVKPFWRP